MSVRSKKLLICKLWDEQRGCCCYCGRFMEKHNKVIGGNTPKGGWKNPSWTTATLEHIPPKAFYREYPDILEKVKKVRGGVSAYDYKLACARCNVKEGEKISILLQLLRVVRRLYNENESTLLCKDDIA